ncbi:MAG: hypothetical protein J2P36_04130 [Ktedonobacteraceae bacterium]|nr:hypothetical protein [Ktedonobacteraceae bacterium]
MPSPFAITAATNTVSLNSSRQGQISFTVSNMTTRVIHSRAHVATQPESLGVWLVLQGEADRDFASAGSQQYAVQITVPPSAPAGDYTLRLDVVDLSNPDDEFSEGPTVRFVVAPPPSAKKPFPWWIVAVAAGVLILLGGGIYSLSQVLKPRTVTTPTVTAPTPTPPPISVEVWQGQFTYSSGAPPFAATLWIDALQNEGAFRGSLSEPVYGNSIVGVSGIRGDLAQLSTAAQSRLQYAMRLYGKGTGTFMEFTDPLTIQGGQITLNCTYDAVVYPDGSLHGVWFFPGHTQPDGTFVLNKTARVAMAKNVNLNYRFQKEDMIPKEQKTFSS